MPAYISGTLYLGLLDEDPVPQAVAFTDELRDDDQDESYGHRDA